MYRPPPVVANRAFLTQSSPVHQNRFQQFVPDSQIFTHVRPPFASLDQNVRAFQYTDHVLPPPHFTLPQAETQFFSLPNVWEHTFRAPPPMSLCGLESYNFPKRLPVPERSTFYEAGSSFQPSVEKLDLTKTGDWEKLVEGRKRLQCFIDSLDKTESKPLLTEFSFSNSCKRTELCLRRIKQKFKELSVMKATATEEQWNEMLIQTEMAKNNLETAMNEVRANSITAQAKARKQKKKREWRKRRRAELHAQKAEQLKRWKEKEDAIDKKMEKMEEEIRRQKEEEQTKAAADTVLSEVKQKQSEAKEMLEILETLAKLRKAKADSAVATGHTLKDESADNAFREKKGFLEELMTRQLADYGKEESALRVMLQPTQEPADEKNYFEGKTASEILALILFGKKDGVAAESTTISAGLEELISVRSEWDHYLVGPGTPFASSIPTSWVYPANPVSQEWKAFLFQEDAALSRR